MKLQSKFEGVGVGYGEVFNAKVKIENEKIAVEVRNEDIHKTFYYSTFADFNKYWQDYKETALDEMIEKLKSDFEKYPDEWDNLADAKNIVKKLEALTRLREKGFKFTGFSEGNIKFKLDKEYSEFIYNGYDEGCEFYLNDEVDRDLTSLFGGEE